MDMRRDCLAGEGMSVKSPLFSIVTISFENVDGLRATVASVKSQSCRDFEHIVIDGGSSDGSAEWLAANFEQIWVSEPDAGRYNAMNKGAQISSGEYLWFMHAGDVFGDPAVLSRVASAIEGRPEGDPEWLYGLARMVDQDKKLVGVMGFVPFSMFNFAILQRHLPHQATAIKRDLFWRLGGHDENIPVAADQLLLLRAANCAPPMVLADFLCNFDSTGISAGRPWWVTYREAAKNLTEAEVPVTRWRVLDKVLVFSYAAFRGIGVSMRRA
jgi:glycosyltransferase involved in cell wall biosynthesis